MSSAEQIQRLLALVPLLQNAELSVNQLAAEFQCTNAQIMKDLKTLWFVGPSSYYSSFIDINIDAVEDDHDSVVRVTNAEYLERPMKLTRAEASSLLVALQLLASDEEDADSSAVARTIAKIQAVSSSGDPQAQVLSPPEKSELVHEFLQAIANDRALELVYYIPSRDETTTRIIDPVEVIHNSGHVYVDAWCHTASGRRLFRLDRVVGIKPAGTARSGSDLQLTPREGGILFDHAQTEATIDLDQEAAWFVDYHPISAIEKMPNGVLRVQLPLVNPEWLVQEVLALAGRGRIVAPDVLADRVKHAVVRARSLYGPTGDSIEDTSERTPRSS
jgi:proteasome accessory factor C